MGELERKPYVVSGDVAGLMQRWSNDNNLFIPSPSFFGDLSKELVDQLKMATNADVDYLPEQYLKAGLEDLIANSDLPVISQDRAYVSPGLKKLIGFIDTTRTMLQVETDQGIKFEDVDEELSPRPGFPSVDQQFATFKSDSSEPVALADDVIFEGHGAEKVSRRLKELNRPVTKVLAAVAIQEGVDYLGTELGIEVESLVTYPDVVDEVCERDFYAGTPMSGRTVRRESTSWSAPYVEPFGNTGWASIPEENARKFSRFCIMNSLIMWQEVARTSGVQIPSTGVPRPLYGARPDMLITTQLYKALETL